MDENEAVQVQPMRSKEARKELDMRIPGINNLLAGICIFIVGGCHSLSAEERDSVDMEITSYVKEALQADPRIEAGNISVETTNGIVTLSGTVPTLAAKMYADEESKKIQDVLGVVNEIEVLPELRYDADIAQDIQLRILFDPSIHSQNITAWVKDGHAVLEGSVSSYEEKQQAGLLAREVRGVKSVDNKVLVSRTARRTDKEIQMDVADALGRDVYLAGLPITVSVDNGVVTLTGQAGSAYQKDRASVEALSVRDVVNVKNELQIKWREDKGVRLRSVIPSNDRLEQDVHDDLLQDLRLDPFTVEVAADSGYVTLRGTVPTFHQRKLADQDAKNVVGVLGVINLLTVAPELRSDQAIARDIQIAIDADSEISGQDIRVRVKNGAVTLTGNVNQPFEKTHAENVVGNIRSVRAIHNELTINKAPKYTDTELAQRIRDRLDSNAYTRINASRIQVSVEKGEATLTGNVDDALIRDEAERIAQLTDGIQSVNNELKISGADSPAKSGGKSP